jgi:hypothetical protein
MFDNIRVTDEMLDKSSWRRHRYLVSDGTKPSLTTDSYQYFVPA